MIKGVLFDLDGTLVDTTEFIFQAFEYVLSFHGYPVVERQVLSPHIGRGIADIYSELAPGADVEALINTHFTFQNEKFDLIKPFPNVAKVLKKLKKLGFKLGVVTSRKRNTIQTLQSGGIEPELFDAIVNADDITKSKPDPEGIFLALKKLNIKQSQVYFVGDAKVDIEMGKNAKVKTIGVTYGFGGVLISESKPDFVIDNLEEVLKILS